MADTDCAVVSAGAGRRRLEPAAGAARLMRAATGGWHRWRGAAQPPTPIASTHRFNVSIERLADRAAYAAPLKRRQVAGTYCGGFPADRGAVAENRPLARLG
ncbi:MAG: hypothetical protein ACKO38_12235 [Planctomycetota bacterium]